MKLIKLIAFAFLLTFLFNINAYAYTLEKKPVDNMWYLRKGGGKEAFSAQFMEYFIDDKVTYCIEPGEHITTDEYIIYNGDNNLHRLVLLIGYFGYGYGDHTTLRHKMATQALIWEITSGQIVEFWTKPSGAGEYITVNPEKQEIMNVVNKHLADPVFDQYEKEISLGDTTTFIDRFDVLSTYEIVEGSDIAKIEGNKLEVTPNKTGISNVKLRKKIYSNDKLIIYEGNDKISQKMAYFGGVDQYISVKVNTKGSSLLIEKVDEFDNLVDGVEFELYDSNNQIISSFITNNGVYRIDNLKYGHYCLKEINTKDELIKMDDSYCFELQNDEETIKIVNKHKKEEVKSAHIQEVQIEEKEISVPKTFMQESYFDIYGVFLGISLIAYEKKKKYN